MCTLSDPQPHALHMYTNQTGGTFFSTNFGKLFLVRYHDDAKSDNNDSDIERNALKCSIFGPTMQSYWLECDEVERTELKSHSMGNEKKNNNKNALQWTFNNNYKAIISIENRMRMQ